MEEAVAPYYLCSIIHFFLTFSSQSVKCYAIEAWLLDSYYSSILTFQRTKSTSVGNGIKCHIKPSQFDRKPAVTIPEQ